MQNRCKQCTERFKLTLAPTAELAAEASVVRIDLRCISKFSDARLVRNQTFLHAIAISLNSFQAWMDSQIEMSIK